jgi:hypothetical protein
MINRAYNYLSEDLGKKIRETLHFFFVFAAVVNGSSLDK